MAPPTSTNGMAPRRPLRHMPRRHRCPRCGHAAIERTPHRNPVERLYLALAEKRPYRCRECDLRFYDRPLPKLRLVVR